MQDVLYLHWSTCATSRIRSRSSSSKNTKVVWYSEVMLWKNDSGSCAVFTEQGSSASPMTTARVLDVIARLLGCAGQASDAVSGHTQVKMKDAPTLLKLPKSECPDIWIRLPRCKWPKDWKNIEELVVPLEANLYGHLLAGCYFWKDSSKKFSL